MLKKNIKREEKGKEEEEEDEYSENVSACKRKKMKKKIITIYICIGWNKSRVVRERKFTNMKVKSYE